MLPLTKFAVEKSFPKAMPYTVIDLLLAKFPISQMFEFWKSNVAIEFTPPASVQ